VRANGRLRVRRLDDRFWFSLQWADVARTDDYADLFPTSKRYDDTRADDNRIGEPFFY
jgi:hypothetical protein